MREIQYLSPSALGVFEKSKDDYYLQYLCDDRPPRLAQTPAMAVGSAFDAFVKSYLHSRIYGANHSEAAKYDLTTLFEAQVEPQNRTEVLKIGAYLFECYTQSGALSDLMLELQSAVEEPRFEFTVSGIVEGKREAIGLTTDLPFPNRGHGVPLLGKPDIRFVNSKGAHCIFDWKVNGWFGKANKSPMAGYVEIREQSLVGSDWRRKGQHPDAFISHYKGMQVNIAGYLESWDSDWATQLATYSWLLGEEVGAENIIGIDQIVGNGLKRRPGGNEPLLRIASHRARISQTFQHSAYARYQNLWNIVTQKPFHFFRDVSLTESEVKCGQLDQRAGLLRNLEPGSDEAEVMRWSRDARAY